ncbi:hypothetical protein [Lactobacillus helveticus]|uniref:hypothetical protein n=1 Tax=Lactobacillus helveticus TaxID=1587 RepID=UPI001F119F2D|nr:hypothetical protein [Lactobacillus helveticus]
MKKLTSTERLNTIKVTSSNAISKFGDVLFDYINSVCYPIVVMVVFGLLYIRVVKY